MRFFSFSDTDACSGFQPLVLIVAAGLIMDSRFPMSPRPGSC